MKYLSTLKLVALAALPVLTGCGIGVEPLMPTPVIYTDSGFEPLAHIPESEQWIPRRIFYATNRERNNDLQRIDYGNTPADHVSVGMALIGFGGPDMTWSNLDEMSRVSDRPEDVTLTIAGIMEQGRFDPSRDPSHNGASHSSGLMLDHMRDVIADARDKDVLIYVHGAKVNFYNACAFAAQLDHFAGRDMTSVAFSWPTHQNIFAYVFGDDVNRAYDAADSLASLIELIASETDAEQIHVVAWSAGARVAMAGIGALRERYPDVSQKELRDRFRIGTAYFVAGDVSVKQFLTHIEDIHSLTNQLVITQTDHDEALEASTRFMGGGRRIGQLQPNLSEEQTELILGLERLEVINVSRGAEERGFDITGHRYWFNHPWASSDVLLTVRGSLPPEARGLAKHTEGPIWYFPSDYPDRLKELLPKANLRSWHKPQAETIDR